MKPTSEIYLSELEKIAKDFAVLINKAISRMEGKEDVDLMFKVLGAVYCYIHEIKNAEEIESKRIPS